MLLYPAGKKGTVAEWLGRGLQNLVQQFESARYLRSEGVAFALFIPYNMSKYSKWLALGAFLLLAVACFLPWTFHADIGKEFNGFFSEKNIYGKPGKFLLSLGAVVLLSAFIPKLWLTRTSLLVAGLNLAYAVKSFLIFGSCYRGYCPEKKAGLFLMLIASALLMLSAMFPAGRIMTKQEEAVSSGEKPV